MRACSTATPAVRDQAVGRPLRGPRAVRHRARGHRGRSRRGRRPADPPRIPRPISPCTGAMHRSAASCTPTLRRRPPGPRHAARSRAWGPPMRMCSTDPSRSPARSPPTRSSGTTRARPGRSSSSVSMRMASTRCTSPGSSSRHTARSPGGGASRRRSRPPSRWRRSRAWRVGRLTIAPDASPVEPALREKHFLRKHGPRAYYGQPGSDATMPGPGRGEP